MRKVWLLLICSSISLCAVNAQDISYLIRVNTLTKLEKLYPYTVDDLDYHKKNFSLGGAIRGRAFGIEGMRLAADYSRYNYSLSEGVVNYNLETYKISPGKDFLVYDSDLRLRLGFEINLGLKTALNYQYQDVQHSKYNELPSEMVENYKEIGTVGNEFYYGAGFIVEMERTLFSSICLGLSFSLNISANSKSYDTRGEYSYSLEGVEDSGSFVQIDSYSGSFYFDPIARIYIGF